MKNGGKETAGLKRLVIYKRGDGILLSLALF